MTITKIDATVDVKPLKLFPLNKASLNISHILHGQKQLLLPGSRMHRNGEHLADVSARLQAPFRITVLFGM